MKTHHLTLRLLIGVAATLLLASPGRAGHVACGDVIVVDTTLDADLGPCPGTGLVIGAPGITLDLDAHRILGDGNGAGIEVDEPLAIIRNGEIIGFASGISGATAGTAIEEVRVARNAGPGIDVTGNDNTIERSRVERNAWGGVGVAGDGNTVERVVSRNNGGSGISAAGNDNRLLRNKARHNGGDGIVAEGDGNVLSRNYTDYNGGSGLVAAGTGNELQRNRARSNQDDGVIATGGGNVDLGGNEGKNNGDVQCEVDGVLCLPGS